MKPLLLLALLAAASLGAGQIRPKHIVVPGYPRVARVARLQGTVSVEIEIGPDGKVISAKASGGHKLLQDAAEENIRQWTFEPSAPSENAPTTLRIAYVYRLEGKEEVYYSPPVVIFDLPERVEIVGHPPKAQP